MNNYNRNNITGIPNEISECIFNREGIYCNPRNKSARYDNYSKRIDKANEQAKIEPTCIDKVILYTNEFLDKCGINTVDTPKICNFDSELFDNRYNSNKFYNCIKKRYNLVNRKDIVWMKFTEDGYLGVVATSDDINFQIPSKKSDYLETNDEKPKSSKNLWLYNNSGIIVHRLGKRWNKELLLIFPLYKIPNGLKRGDIENGIGNYLINKGVPILDYYSHRF
jgi:hypothetical protein